MKFGIPGVNIWPVAPCPGDTVRFEVDSGGSRPAGGKAFYRISYPNLPAPDRYTEIPAPGWGQAFHGTFVVPAEAHTVDRSATFELFLSDEPHTTRLMRQFWLCGTPTGTFAPVSPPQPSASAP